MTGGSRTAEDLVAVRYAHAVSVAVVVIVAVWHFGYDVLIVLRGWGQYEPRWAAAGAWLALAVIQAVGSVLLLRSALGRRMAWALSTAALSAGAAATAAYPAGQAISDISWAWNTVGWFGVLLLMRRPLSELAVLLTLNTAVTVVVLALDGDLDDSVTWSRLITVTYATAGIQLIFALLGRQLHQAARHATRTVGAHAESLARAVSNETVHADRRRRYMYLRERIEPLLYGLADGCLDPSDDAVRRATAIEASRLRRLFAETDEVPHPLLHEIRACADIAERRDVAVTLAACGDLPSVPVSVRRALIETPLLVLASARARARVTVVADVAGVTVSVVADAPSGNQLDPPGSGIRLDRADRLETSVLFDEEENQLWVETRWSAPPDRLRSASSKTTPS
ncbi:hypothetical protein ACH4U7_18830 [Streptomyces sp. NPDC020845]|uniref:hypothetical protein n=1 Tax=Streptomyces sp. NPDC020845 TaxID=3365096 RepID=UPI0037B94A11